MEVRAKRKGFYYVSKIKEGQEFTINHIKEFSFAWMEPVHLEDWAKIREFDEWLHANKFGRRYKPSGFYYPDLESGPEAEQPQIDLAEAFDKFKADQETEAQEEEPEPTKKIRPISKKVGKKVTKKASPTVRAADREVI